VFVGDIGIVGIEEKSKPVAYVKISTHRKKAPDVGGH